MSREEDVSDSRVAVFFGLCRRENGVVEIRQSYATFRGNEGINQHREVLERFVEEGATVDSAVEVWMVGCDD